MKERQERAQRRGESEERFVEERGRKEINQEAAQTKPAGGAGCGSARARQSWSPSSRVEIGGWGALLNLRSVEILLFSLHNANMVDEKNPPCIWQPNHVAPFPRRRR